MKNVYVYFPLEQFYTRAVFGIYVGRAFKKLHSMAFTSRENFFFFVLVSTIGCDAFNKSCLYGFFCIDFLCVEVDAVVLPQPRTVEREKKNEAFN